MVMRLVRDEPDAVLDEVRAEGIEGEPTVLSDLAPTGTTAPGVAPSGRPRRAGGIVPIGPVLVRDTLDDAAEPIGPRRRNARRPAGPTIRPTEHQPPFGVTPLPDADSTDPDSPAAAESADAEPRAESTDAAANEATANEATPNEATPNEPTADEPATADVAQIAEPARAAEPADGEMSDGSVASSAESADGDPDDADGPPDPGLSLPTLEALLLSTHHPLTPQRLGELLDAGSVGAVRKAVAALNASYEASGRCFRIEQVAGGYQILTLPEHGDALKRLHQKEADAKLSKAALETLAIVAYKQPILRADVEAIRGVACGETIRSLMEKHLVKIAGRAEIPGRPILYGTTKRFLELFGLNSLKDLPRPEEFKPPAAT